MMLYSFPGGMGESSRRTPIPQQSGTLYYTGSSQSPTWTGYDTSRMSITGGDTSATNVGTYSTTFTLDTPYIWTDGTSGAKQVNWYISKIQSSITLSSYSLAVDARSSKTVTASNYYGTLTASTSASSKATASVSGSTITITGVAEGTATITVTSSGDSTHDGASATISVAVSAASSWVQSTLPSGQTYAREVCLVVYNNQLHMIGGSTSQKKHYRFNGSTWTELADTPFSSWRGRALVYNNKIHIFNAYENEYTRYHWEYNGSTWTKVDRMDILFIASTNYFSNFSVFVYQNKIRLIRGDGQLYTYDNGSWTLEEGSTSIDFKFSGSSSVVYGNEQLVSEGSGLYHMYDVGSRYSYNLWDYGIGSANERGNLLLYKNKLRIIGGSGNNTQRHYKGTDRSNPSTISHIDWTRMDDLPIEADSYSACVVFNNQIHLINDAHYIYSGD